MTLDLTFTPVDAKFARTDVLDFVGDDQGTTTSAKLTYKFKVSVNTPDRKLTLDDVFDSVETVLRDISKDVYGADEKGQPIVPLSQWEAKITKGRQTIFNPIREVTITAAGAAPVYAEKAKAWVAKLSAYKAPAPAGA